MTAAMVGVGTNVGRLDRLKVHCLPENPAIAGRARAEGGEFDSLGRLECRLQGRILFPRPCP